MYVQTLLLWEMETFSSCRARGGGGVLKKLEKTSCRARGGGGVLKIIKSY